jgi:crossover junction endodeoxyribonuclease RusA
VIYYLPYPISANRYWRNFRGRIVRSSEAVAYKERVAWENARSKPLCSNVAVIVTLQPKLTKKGEASKTVIDLDNALKVALDALQGVAYNNDKQIRKISAEYGVPRVDGGLIVQVVEMV